MYDVVLIGKDLTSDDIARFRNHHPHAIVLTEYKNMVDAMQRCSRLCFTEMYHMVALDDRFDDTRMDWKPTNLAKTVPYYLQASSSAIPYDDVGRGSALAFDSGIYLMPVTYRFTERELATGDLETVRVVDTDAASYSPFDIFFVSYNETNADGNWDKIKRRWPWAKRVHGIKGIDNAHRRCAKLSQTEMFWTIDADTELDPSWDFGFVPPDYDRQYLHVWHTNNPVNGLVYGYGAVKLWPGKHVVDFKGKWLDFTTSVGGIKMKPESIATSAFNTDAYSAWRSGFRETVKLCHNVYRGDHGESLDRLVTWLTVSNDVPYAQDALKGAMDGACYFIEMLEAKREDAAKLINDFEWLRDRFNNMTANDMPVMPTKAWLASKLAG